MEEMRIPDPITPEDIPYLPDVDEMEKEELKVLLRRLTVLYGALEAEEPEWDGEEDGNEVHAEWMEQLEEIDDLMDDIRDRLET